MIIFLRFIQAVKELEANDVSDSSKFPFDNSYPLFPTIPREPIFTDRTT